MSSSSTQTARAMLLPSGRHAGKPAVPLRSEVTLIGTRSSAHVQLLSSQVSKIHAVIVNDGGRFYIHDTKSRTHVFVNGKQVVDSDLADGDLIAIGPFQFKFSGPSPQEPPRFAPPCSFEADDGHTVEMTGRVLTIGRRGTCEISIPDEEVSTMHAVVVTIDGKLFFRDAGSRTGSRINGQSQRKGFLNPGDRLSIGPGLITCSLSQPLSADDRELENLAGTAPLLPEDRQAAEAAGAAAADAAPIEPAEESAHAEPPPADEPPLPLDLSPEQPPAPDATQHISEVEVTDAAGITEAAPTEVTDKPDTDIADTDLPATAGEAPSAQNADHATPAADDTAVLSAEQVAAAAAEDAPAHEAAQSDLPLPGEEPVAAAEASAATEPEPATPPAPPEIPTPPEIPFVAVVDEPPLDTSALLANASLADDGDLVLPEHEPADTEDAAWNALTEPAEVPEVVATPAEPLSDPTADAIAAQATAEPDAPANLPAADDAAINPLSLAPPPEPEPADTPAPIDLADAQTAQPTEAEAIASDTAPTSLEDATAPQDAAPPYAAAEIEPLPLPEPDELPLDVTPPPAEHPTEPAPLILDGVSPPTEHDAQQHTPQADEPAELDLSADMTPEPTPEPAAEAGQPIWPAEPPADVLEPTLPTPESALPAEAEAPLELTDTRSDSGDALSDSTFSREVAEFASATQGDLVESPTEPDAAASVPEPVPTEPAPAEAAAVEPTVEPDDDEPPSMEIALDGEGLTGTEAPTSDALLQSAQSALEHDLAPPATSPQATTAGPDPTAAPASPLDDWLIAPSEQPEEESFEVQLRPLDTAPPAAPGPSGQINIPRHRPDLPEPQLLLPEGESAAPTPPRPRAMPPRMSPGMPPPQLLTPDDYQPPPRRPAPPRPAGPSANDLLLGDDAGTPAGGFVGGLPLSLPNQPVNPAFGRVAVNFGDRTELLQRGQQPRTLANPAEQAALRASQPIPMLDLSEIGRGGDEDANAAVASAAAAPPPLETPSPDDLLGDIDDEPPTQSTPTATAAPTILAAPPPASTPDVTAPAAPPRPTPPMRSAPPPAAAARYPKPPPKLRASQFPRRPPKALEEEFEVGEGVGTEFDALAFNVPDTDVFSATFGQGSAAEHDAETQPSDAPPAARAARGAAPPRQPDWQRGPTAPVEAPTPGAPAPDGHAPHGQPIPPAPTMPLPVALPHRRNSVPALLVIMLLLMAAVSAAIWYLTPLSSVVEGRLLFERYATLAPDAQKRWRDEQYQQLTSQRRNAEVLLRETSPGTASGWLSEPELFASRLSDKAITWQPDGAMIIRLVSDDPEHDPRRVAMLLRALYHSNNRYMAQAKLAEDRVSRLESAIARDSAQQADLTRRIDELAGAAVNMLQLRREHDDQRAAVTRLERQWTDAVGRVKELEAEVQRLSRAATQPAARHPTTRPVDAGVATAEAALDAGLTALSNKLQQLPGAVASDQRLRGFLALARQMHEQTAMLSQRLLQRQKESQLRLDQLRWRLAEVVQARRADAWSKDQPLADLLLRQSLAVRKLSAARDAREDDATLARLQTELDDLTRQVDARRAQVGRSELDDQLMRELDNHIAAGRKRLEEDQAELDRTMERLGQAMLDAAPPADALTDEQRAGLAALNQQLAALRRARTDYARALAAADEQEARRARDLDTPLAALASSDAGHAATLAAGDSPAELLRTRQADLADARRLEGEARTLWTDAQRRLAELATQLEQARAAGTQRDELLRQRDQLAAAARQQQEDLQNARETLLRTVAPVLPDESSVTVQPYDDPRLSYLLYANGALLVVFVALVLLASRRT